MLSIVCAGWVLVWQAGIAQKRVLTGRLNALSLMFGKEEIDQLFIETFQLPLGPDQIETLHQKTNGWVSGLILFYHSLGGGRLKISRPSWTSFEDPKR